MLIPVIAVFDVGKTNKKLFLFNEQYHIVYEKSARFLETKDEDGDSCENLDSLRLSVFDSLNEVLKINKYDIKAINFSTYGASFVYLDEEGKPLTPLYNYLKPYPKELEELFYKIHGNPQKIAQETSSPASGSLNSGMQLYRIKHQKPDIFKQIKYVLHLPQYMSNLITGKYFTDMTSIGCHTQLWDFNKKDYHQWVYDEKLVEKLPKIFPADDVIEASFMGKTYKTGVGLHDSSAALIPYLVNFKEPFVLLSTGTWCISLNPFNESPLTSQELENDCLAYIAYHGKPVKASRLFAGFELEQQSKRVAAHFKVDALIFRTMPFDAQLAAQLKERFKNENQASAILPKQSKFGGRDLSSFANEKDAYHQLVADIIDLQSQSTALIIKGSTIRKIFVDGGFSKNTIYMNLLARAFPQIEVYAASMAQATALGAAVAIHQHWNTKALPNDIIELKYYSVNQPVLG